MALDKGAADVLDPGTLATIRRLVGDHGRLALNAATLPADADLYEAGLSSVATLQVMLAIEEAFNLEFPDRWLNRRTFRSLATLSLAVTELLSAIPSQ